MKTLLLSRLSLVVCLILSTFTAFGQAGLVISQVYGGGGNSGATYTNDFIELYNASSSPVSLAGLSVQYASATGTSWNAATLPSVSVAAGHYYLIQAAAGSGTDAALPTPDLILTLSNVSSSFVINLSATAGKVALVNTITPLTVACPTGASILDFVGYGTTANCFEGAAAAPTTTTNAQSIVRTVSSVDTNNNSADFSTISPPTPRNASYVAPAGAALSATGSANPATVAAGGTTTLTVNYVPGTLPASTGVTVSIDLTQIGGANNQNFAPNGVNSYSTSVTVTTTVNGTITLPVTVTDAQGRTANASIMLAVSQPTPTLAISAIQGVKSTTAATVSPYVGKLVQTSGIVTAILPNGFFIQSRDSDADGNPLTPEGVEVFTSSTPPAATVALGNYVQVRGTVSTFPAVTVSHTPATELTSPAITLLSTGNALPAPITLTPAMLTPGGGLYQLTPYEGMRVLIASLTTSSGTNGSITSANEATETATSTGYFYAVMTGTPRPFREPGIDIRDPAVPGLPANVASFDDNPERILVDSVIGGGTSIELSTGAVLTNASGVLDFTFSNDSFYDPSRLILDPSYNRANVTAGMTVQPVPRPAATEFTVASYNVERFYNPAQATPDDLYYVPSGVLGFNPTGSGVLSTGQTFISSAVDVTPAAYQRRLQKFSLAVRTVLNMPDIVTLEEVENQSVANDMAAQINTDAGISGLYTAYSTDNSTYYTQDGTGISVGFLVKNTVDKLGLTQFGAGETFTPMSSTSPITLNDRPWLVLQAGLKRAGAKDYPVTVVVNHMKALTGENSPTSTSTRQKKELQAEDIAKYIQTLQAARQHVISGGDFNAFEFSDGYIDTLATYTNVNVLPATQVVQPGVAGLVVPPLVDMALTLPANQRWSYQEDGNAQILDHMVVTPELVAGGAHFAYAHLNADFPLTAYNDATTAARTSDHDVAVGYFPLPAPVVSATLTPSSATYGTTAILTASGGQVFTLSNTGEAPLPFAIATTGDFAQSSNCVSPLALSATCSINVVFTPTGGGPRLGLLTVTATGASTPKLVASLSGTGIYPNFTIGDGSGNTATTLTVVAGGTATTNLTVTPVNGFNGTITVTCATPSGVLPTGIVCVPPSPLTLGTAAVTLPVNFTTTQRTIRVAGSGFSLTAGDRSPGTLSVMVALAGLLMLLAGRAGRGGRLSKVAGLLTLLLALCLPSMGCGSGSTLTNNPAGTPAGTYTFLVNAAGGNLVHTETVTLIVQ